MGRPPLLTRGGGRECGGRPPSPCGLVQTGYAPGDEHHLHRLRDAPTFVGRTPCLSTLPPHSSPQPPCFDGFESSSRRLAVQWLHNGESCWLNLFDIQLVRYTGKVIYPAVRTTASTHRLNDSTPHDNRSGLATPGESGDDCWLYQYVLVEIVSMVPCSTRPVACLAPGSRAGC